jgi:hypothetical protein
MGQRKAPNQISFVQAIRLQIIQKASGAEGHLVPHLTARDDNFQGDKGTPIAAIFG